MLGTKQLWFLLSFIKLGLITNILQNIFFYVPQKKEMHTGWNIMNNNFIFG